MSIKRNNGLNPTQGKVTTSMGLREPRPPLCEKCGRRVEGVLYTRNANGQQVCPDCAGSVGEGILRAKDKCCDPGTCACGSVELDEIDPS